MGKICTFFGCNDLSKSVWPQIQTKVEKLIIDQDVNIFLIADCGKPDDIVFDVLLRLKKVYSKIRIILVISHELQLQDKKNYLMVDEVEYPEIVKAVSDESAFILRNLYMLYRADFIITCVKNDLRKVCENLAFVRENAQIIFLE